MIASQGGHVLFPFACRIPLNIPTIAVWIYGRITGGKTVDRNADMLHEAIHDN